MDTARLEGIYEMALELGKGKLQAAVGNSGTTEERMQATALLLALDEHQLIAADVMALAKFVAAVQPPADHDWSEEAPIKPRIEAAYTELRAYFDSTNRTPPWFLLALDEVPF